MWTFNERIDGTHFISYCISFGLPVVTAASLLSFMGIFDLIGTTVSGWLSDRFDNRWLLFWYYGLRGASLVLLPFALQEGSIILLIIFSVFYGLDWIATVPPTISISRQVFGIEKSGMYTVGYSRPIRQVQQRRRMAGDLSLKYSAPIHGHSFLQESFAYWVACLSY